MLKLSWKFGESKWYPYWVIVLTSSSGTNYVLNEHEDVDQYGSFSIPSELVLYQSHPESLVNQNEILIGFSYIPNSAIRRSGSARYFSVRHYRIAEKFHNNDADSSLQSMFTFSRPITALLTGALAVQGHGQVTWPDTSICSFIG